MGMRFAVVGGMTARTRDLAACVYCGGDVLLPPTVRDAVCCRFDQPKHPCGYCGEPLGDGPKGHSGIMHEGCAQGYDLEAQ